MISAHCNGGLIQRGKNGVELLKSEGLPRDAVLSVAEAMRNRSCFLFFADGLSYISADRAPGARDWFAYGAQCASVRREKPELTRVQSTWVPRM
jgi:hypothetical protein